LRGARGRGFPCSIRNSTTQFGTNRAQIQIQIQNILVTQIKHNKLALQYWTNSEHGTQPLLYRYTNTLDKYIPPPFGQFVEESATVVRKKKRRVSFRQLNCVYQKSRAQD
jgi:hypothetical protein